MSERNRVAINVGQLLRSLERKRDLCQEAADRKLGDVTWHKEAVIALERAIVEVRNLTYQGIAEGMIAGRVSLQRVGGVLKAAQESSK